MASAPSDIEQALREFFADRETVPVGKFQLFNLDAVRANFGERWERISGRVVQVATLVIRAALGPRDLFIPCRDLAFIVMFAELSRNEAEIKSLMIASQIARRLTGEDGMKPEDLVASVVVDLDRSVTATSGNLEDSINQLIAAEAKGAPHRPSAGAAADRPKGIPQAAEPAREPPDAIDPNALRVRYWPIWDVRRRVLSTFFCSIENPSGEREVPNGLGGRPSEARARLDGELDRFMLEFIARDLKALHAAGRRVLMGCAVHYETLANYQRRESFLIALRSLHANQAKDLVLQLSDVAEDVPPSRIAGLLDHVRMGVRGIGVRVRLIGHSMNGLRQAGVRLAAVDFAPLAHRDADLLPAMEDFVARARTAGLATVAHGVAQPSLAVAALGAGFDYVEGEAIHSPVADPEFILRYELDDMFSHLGRHIGRTTA